jgi:hypothetical protein
MGAGKFTRVDNAIFEDWLPEIDYKGAAVYAYVCYRSNHKRRTGCFESLDNMAKSLKMDRRTLRLKLKELVDKGLLERQRRKHNTTIYRPAPIPQKDKNALLKDGVEKDKNGLLKNPQKEVFVRSKVQKCPTNKTKITKPKGVGEDADDLTLVKAYRTEFEQTFNEPLEPVWGKDRKLAKTKLRRHSLTDLQAKIPAFFNWWEKNWRAKNGDLPLFTDFISNLERIRGAATEPVYTGKRTEHL